MRSAIGLLWLLTAIAPTHVSAQRQDPTAMAPPQVSAEPQEPATVALVGSPPYVRYAPDLDVYPQNFAIAQDSRGIVFVGNTNGVLEFDGERWSLTALPNREMVRSLAIDADDRVYVGGYNALGYLERDISGVARFVDLTPHFRKALHGREFADIWDTLVTPEGVYFRAIRDMFFWDPKRDVARHWRHEGRFGAIAHHKGETLLQFRGEGFRRRAGDRWTPLPETHAMTGLVFELIPLGDGGLLTLGVDGAWWRIGNDEVAAVAMPASLPPSSNFQHARALADHSLVFVGSEGTVYIVDPTRKNERHFKVDPGFLSGVAPAIDGGFLVAANEAVYRVGWPTRWTVLGAEHGADGTLHSLVRWNGVDFLLSSAGIFRVAPDSGGTPHFERAPWDKTLWGAAYGYDLLEIDARRALLATAHHLMVVENDKLRQISPELVYPRIFVRSRFRTGRVYVGTETGLRHVDVLASGIAVSPLANEGLDMRVSSIVELSARELWFGTERHGAWRVRLADDGSIVEQKRYGEADGLRLGVIPEAAIEQLADGALVVSSSQGFFHRDGERFVADDLSGLEKLRADEELLTLAQAANGDLWAYGIGRLFHRPAGVQWIEQSIRQLRRGAFESHVISDDGRALFVATQSLLLYDGGSAGATRKKLPQVRLRSATLTKADGSVTPLPLNPGTVVRLPYGDYSLAFEFALPDLTQQHGRSYQSRLVGYQEKYSDWSSVRSHTYSRLAPGTYSLQVRARDGAGNVSEIDPYRLVIEPPWYSRWWAYLAYAVLGISALWWIVRQTVRRRTSRLEEAKVQLEETVADRTRDLAVANRRLESMAHLDGLTGIANRRRLDEYLAVVWAQGRERKRHLAVLAIDVDHFKRFNDTHGHLAGDLFLKRLVGRLTHCLRRAEDLLARYGGEEFLVVLPGATSAVATLVAENMRRDIEASDLGATISIGVASWIPRGDDVALLVAAADTALYAAKHAGRNRVVASDSHGPK